MNKNKNPIFSLRLEPKLTKLLQRLADEKGVTRTDIIRLALIEYSAKKDIAGTKNKS